MNYLQDSISRAVYRGIADWTAHGGTLHDIIMGEVDDALLCLAVIDGLTTLDDLTSDGAA